MLNSRTELMPGHLFDIICVSIIPTPGELVERALVGCQQGAVAFFEEVQRRFATEAYELESRQRTDDAEVRIMNCILACVKALMAIVEPGRILQRYPVDVLSSTESGVDFATIQRAFRRKGWTVEELPAANQADGWIWQFRKQ